MRILIVGGGGREHALAYWLQSSQEKVELFVAPGNAGTGDLGVNVSIPAGDIDGLTNFAKTNRINLTIVGPELPLVRGIVDAFDEARMPVVGPTRDAALVEGSKAFARAFMNRHGIPGADFAVFDAFKPAADYVRKAGAPLVVKASGLAAGKGAHVCATEEEALESLKSMLVGRLFGDAGAKVVIEEFMDGEEASIFVLTDGDDYMVLAPAQDHKRVGEADTGPNTGGMGAYAPAPVLDSSLLEKVISTIVEPTLLGLAQEGRRYKGCLYVGLMITAQGPKVVEYNCRFGDPEAQVVLPLVGESLLEVFVRLTEGRLGSYNVEVPAMSAACVVMASGGYPSSYRKGIPVQGLASVASIPGVTVYHAGTAADKAGRVVTSGGRVLGVTGIAPGLAGALERAYEGVRCISFEDSFFRSDIGYRGIRR